MKNILLIVAIIHAQLSFGYYEVNSCAKALANTIERSVDDYSTSKEAGDINKVAFLTKEHDGVIDIYIDLATYIRNFALKKAEFSQYRFSGFLQILRALCRWYEEGKLSNERGAEYLATLQKREFFGGTYSNAQNRKKMQQKFAELKEYLQPLKGITYEELLAFSHFLASTVMPDDGGLSWESPGASYFQTKLEQVYLDKPVAEYTTIMFSFGSMAHFIPSRLAFFSTVIPVLPCPFDWTIRDFIKAYKAGVAPMGIAINPVMAEGLRMYPGEFALHDVFHLGVFLLTYYGYAIFSYAKEETHVPPKLWRDLISLSNERLSLDRNLVKAVEQKMMAVDSDALSSEPVKEFLLKEYQECLACDKEMFCDMVRLSLFFFTHEYFQIDGNWLTHNLLYLNGDEDQYQLLLKENIDRLFHLFNDDHRFENSDHLYKIYTQIVKSQHFLVTKTSDKTEFIKQYKRNKKRLRQINVQEARFKIQDSPTYLVFFDDNLLLQNQGAIDYFFPFAKVIAKAPWKITLPARYLIVVPQMGGEGVYRAVIR